MPIKSNPKEPHQETLQPEELQQAVSQFLLQIPYMQTLGIKPHFMGSEFTLILPYKDENIGNPALPALHGGAIGGLMEVAAIAQIILENPSMMDITHLPKPIGVNVDYLRRGRPMDCFARAQIFKQGARVANLRVRAWQQDFDTPIATLTGHFLLKPAESEADNT